MATAIGSLLRSGGNLNRCFNILTFPTHERYASNWSSMSHTFYLYHAEGIKTWNSIYAPLPANHILLNGELGVNQIPPEIDFDLILSQNKFGQFQLAKQLSRLLCLPILSIEQTLPMTDWPKDYISQVKQMKGNVNAFISEYSREKWGWTSHEAEVVHHGIDANRFAFNKQEGRKPVVLSVCNDWINRDIPCGFKAWEEASKDLPVKVLGDTPGLSKPASSLEELVNAYQTSQVFLNTSQVSPIPTSLLEAMSCGCAIVSSATCMIPEVIRHGENGFLGQTPEELNYYCKELLNDKRLAQKFGESARRTVEEKFSLPSFLSKWDALFTRTVEIGYRY